MGEGLVAVLEQMVGIQPSVVVDTAPGRALQAFSSAGIPKKKILKTDDPDQALNAISDGRRVATSNVCLAWCQPMDIAVEATGVPEVGALVAQGAIESGKHVMQMNVETDATVGYVLRRMAKEAGVVYTLSGGDEPGAVMELYDFATTLGLEVVSAGKGKNNRLDRSATPDSVAKMAQKRRMNPKMLASFVDGTKTMVEMTSLANGIGFVPDVRGMHGPLVTVDTLASTYIPSTAGGVLSRPGRVDYGRGVAPGVFVVFTTDHPKLIQDLEYLSMGPGPYYALYRPYHLANIETPISIVRAVLSKETTLATDQPPTAETVAFAKRNLVEGETIADLGGYRVYGMIDKSETTARECFLPVGLAPGALVTSPIKKGEPLTYNDVNLDDSSHIVTLRRLQDSLIGGTI
jgi:predicted homoserine dehydrogenase-like protein